MATAGRILIIPKGEYSSATTYEQLDLVRRNGSTWLCKKTCKGIAPSEENEEYWYLFTDNSPSFELLEELGELTDDSLLFVGEDGVAKKVVLSKLFEWFKEKIGGVIKYKDVTVITNADGTVPNALCSTSVKVINAVLLSPADYYVQIYPGWNGAHFGAIARKTLDNTPLASTSVTIRYYYIE